MPSFDRRVELAHGTVDSGLLLVRRRRCRGLVRLVRRFRRFRFKGLGLVSVEVRVRNKRRIRRVVSGTSTRGAVGGGEEAGRGCSGLVVSVNGSFERRVGKWCLGFWC